MANIADHQCSDLPKASGDIPSPVALGHANDATSRQDVLRLPFCLCFRLLLFFLGRPPFFLEHSSFGFIVRVVIFECNCRLAYILIKKAGLELTVLIDNLGSRRPPLRFGQQLDNDHIAIDRPIHRLTSYEKHGLVQTRDAYSSLPC